ncbi:hypothetical protein FCR2A7T_23240 [Flavobacterium cauense R2A-7]|uniref:4-amino-4-deoxy-L-arabinose transferase-like glycosyltransferase n=1 Tax=Flavobacterium cauense R2A-7 TaxID=1341154 RepID=V6RWR4_9FLAO|nr:DUF6056 family protein [Flavobacterium cauense]ESU18918.1 hypothetical protein FCR2A7T_23240 [Flavobacterium cauense R2A-7]KGO82445.1 hypothetical protein Q762_07185 [Flavobacterium cauense R2A-7]TWI15422.1 hypothetical protein IP98_00415 [Flavobacterium cauense R2A-7]
MTFLKNKKNILLIITGLLAITLILLLNINTFYWADDYAILNEINDLGIYQRCIHGYYAWDGRYLTPAAFLQGVFLETLPVEIITLIWNACFLLSGILLFYVIKEETKDYSDSSDKIYLPFLVAVIFWLGSYRHIGQTIYWATGGVYTFNLLLGAVWLLLFYKIQKTSLAGLKFGFLLFTLFIGLTTQNLTIGFITFLLLTIVNDYLKNEQKNCIYNGVLLLIIVGGTLFLSLAPGNFVRAEEINNSAFKDISLWMLVRNTAFALVTYLLFSFILIIISVLAAFVYVFQNGRTITPVFKKLIFIPKTKEQGIAFIATYKYLIVALSTILPFITMPEVVSPRTAIYFMFFLVIFIFKFIHQLAVVPLNKKETKATSVIAYILFFSVFCFVIYNFQRGKTLKAEVKKRELLLKNSKNKEIRLRRIDENLKSYCYDFRDFRGNDDWAVEAQKIYFGCIEIRIED